MTTASPTASRARQELDRVEQLLQRLLEVIGRHQHAISVDAADIDDLATASEGLRELGERLDKHRTEMSAMADRIDALQGRLRFLPEAWPHERSAIEQRLRQDEVDGIASWLTAWAVAAGEWRLDAMSRLVDDLQLPPSVTVVRDKLRAATAALSSGTFAAAEPVLRALAGGVVSGGRALVTALARGKLYILLARLETSRTPDLAFRALVDIDAAADLLGESGAVIATRAELARRSEDREQFARLAGECRPHVTNDLGALVAQVHMLAGTGTDASALDAVLTEAVPALIDRDDVASEAARLHAQVPAPLWLAIAAAALDANRLDLAESSLYADTDWSGEYLARAGDLRVRLMRARQRPESEITEAIVATARNWLMLDPPRADAAVRRFEEAYARDPSHRVGVQMADALWVASSTAPLDTARDDLLRALELVQAAAISGMPTGLDWAFLTEAAIRERLAQYPSPDSAEQEWRAAMATLRALIGSPTDAQRWQWFANNLRLIYAFHCAVSAAARAVELDPEDETIRHEAITALTNVGSFDDALAHLDQLEPNDWRSGARGYIVLRLGDPVAAMEHLVEACRVEPPMWWAWTALLAASVLGGDDRTQERALALWTLAQQRSTEVDAMEASALAALYLGHTREAQRWATAAVIANPASAYARELVGAARLLEGDVSGGLESMRESIGLTSTSKGLDDYERLTWRELHLLARQSGVDVPPYELIASDVERQRIEVVVATDPWRELEMLRGRRVGNLPGALVALVTHWAAAMLAVAAGESTVATTEKDRLAELQGLKELERVRDEAVAAVMALTTEGHDDPAALPTRAEAPATRDELKPDRPVRLRLPGTWFAAMSDPNREHPLFTSALPQTRWALDWELPPVSVESAPELEPDSYEVLLFNRLVDAGRARTNVRYCFAASLHLLDQATTQPLGGDELLPGIVAIARDGSTEEGFTALVTMSVEEAVVRRVALVVEREWRDAGAPAWGNDGRPPTR